MKITIIPEDQIITIDGRTVECAFSAPSNWHAVQWDGHTGHIQKKLGEPEILTTTDTLVPYIAIHAAKVAELDAPPPQQPASTPTSVSMRQARLALLAEGHLATVNAAMSTQPEAAQIEWEYATEVRRDSPLTAAMGALLGLSEAQMDALFLAASVL